MLDEWPKASDVRVTMHTLPLGTVTSTYEWVGESPFLIVSGYLIGEVYPDLTPETGAKFNFGPYRVKIIDHDYVRDCFLCVRVGSFPGTMRVWTLHLRQRLKGFYARLIMTAFIWGWAERPDVWMPYTWEPSWRDLRWPGWRKRKERKDVPMPTGTPHAE